MLKGNRDQILDEEETQLVVFFLGEEKYALEIFDVKEVIKKPEIISVPNSPDFIRGIIDLRGEVIPVLDLKKRLHLPIAREEREGYIIVIREEREKDKNFGLLADGVLRILSVPTEKIEKTPESFKAIINSQFLKGVAIWEEKILVILNTRSLLKDEHRDKIKKVS